jgi:hypothetical protein
MKNLYLILAVALLAFACKKRDPAKELQSDRTTTLGDFTEYTCNNPDDDGKFALFNDSIKKYLRPPGKQPYWPDHELRDSIELFYVNRTVYSKKRDDSLYFYFKSNSRETTHSKKPAVWLKFVQKGQKYTYEMGGSSGKIADFAHNEAPGNPNFQQFVPGECARLYYMITQRDTVLTRGFYDIEIVE